MPLKLSAFMGNYNDGKSLPRALTSLMTQTRPPDELVIVDDGSRDDSVKIVREYQEIYPAIKLIINQANRGILDTIERVPHLLKGDYIYGASANDYVLPGFFKEAMAIAEAHPQAGIIFGEVEYEDTEGNLLYGVGVKKWVESLYANPAKYLAECLEVEPPQHSWSAATIYRREPLIANGGFNPDLKAWCDTFAARALGLQHGVCYIASPCVRVVAKKDSLSGRMMANTREVLGFIKEAERLMLSEKFKSTFPEEHVRRWAAGYRISVIGKWVLVSLGLGGLLGGGNQDSFGNKLLTCALSVYRWTFRKKLAVSGLLAKAMRLTGGYVKR